MKIELNGSDADSNIFGHVQKICQKKHLLVLSISSKLEANHAWAHVIHRHCHESRAHE
jgi:hypothetical protein